MPDLPNKFRAWEQPPIVTTEEVIKQYERGYAGALYSQQAAEEFRAGISIATGEEVCSIMGYEESAKGKLVLPIIEVLKAYPGCMPGGGQLFPDCVSWDQRNANLLTMVCEVVAGLPDPVSGYVEELPIVSDVARRYGVFSTEAIYAFRSTKPGGGWYCHEAARVSQTKAGCVLRKDYGEINLEKYTNETGSYYDRRKVPPAIANQWDDNIVRDATEIKTFEALRDLLDRGFGVSTCGSESWSSTRDENGVCSRTSQGWAHAMAFVGVDDRPWAHETYGGPLVLIQNSWNEYMTGPRKVHGTDLEIPPGSFWSKWRDASRRSMIAMAGVNGWARKQLPDYDPGL